MKTDRSGTAVAIQMWSFPPVQVLFGVVACTPCTSIPRTRPSRAESRRVALQSVPGITFVNVAGEIEVFMELGAINAVGFACPVLCVKLPTARESVSFLCDRNTE